MNQLGERTHNPEVRKALGASRGAFVMTGLFSFFINLLMLTAPLYMLQIYDRVLVSRSESTLLALTALAGAMLLVMGALDLIRSRVLVRVGGRINRALNARVFTAAFQHTMQDSKGGRSQALRDLDGLRQFMTGPGLFAFFDAPWVPVYLAVIFLLHPMLGWVALAGAVLLFTIALVNELLTRRVMQSANEQITAAYGFAENSLRNAEVLEAMGMMEGVLRRWTMRHDKALALQARASDRSGTFSVASKASRIFLQVGILGVGAWLAIQQIITPGVMIAASIIMGRALSPVEQAIGHWSGFLSARSAYRGLESLLAAHPRLGRALTLPRPRGALSVENLFAIPPGAMRPALKGLTFSLSPGEALGVIGPSAAGKSTLARVLVGVWPPASGSVRLEGAKLEAWSAAERGPFIGYLPQDVELFAGTVAENIARFADEPDSEQIVLAARRAGVHEMILRLEEGYQTQIGENGTFLSGGQRQRIGLARAVYGEPALVVMDEPNSNLDSAGDHALAQAVQVLKQLGVTVVVMAHRPSAIAAVDKLLVVHDGRIEAFGDKNDVLAKVTRQVPSTAGSVPEPAVAAQGG